MQWRIAGIRVYQAYEAATFQIILTQKDKRFELIAT